MLGTFGGALEARQIDASNGKLTAEVTGEVETEDNVLVIRRIHVAMRLVADPALKDKIDRVHSLYAMNCPLYRTLHKAIELTSSYGLAAEAKSSSR
ncbi:MAG: OsmC family peroxiredoxin [Candidatus Acidoferrum typicum]|nr:OsmC family peroxiredoxin [Candidatus Acidoferrum typicum]